MPGTLSLISPCMARSCLFLALGLPMAEGHAFMAEPPSRNAVANRLGKEYCPHCLQGGGPTTVITRAGGRWPTKDVPESHGLCGDPVQGSTVKANWRDEVYLVPTPVQRTYTAGEEVEFSIKVNAHHMGHYEFRMCEKALDGKTLASREEGQACLNTWLLERAPPLESCQPNDVDPDCQPLDTDHPERWFLPPSRGSGEVHKMRYKIPADLHCSHCTLQWYWATGNTCLYDDSYRKHFAKMEAAGWPAKEWCPLCAPGHLVCGETFGEEFWNCADVAVLAPGEQPVVPDLGTTTLPSVDQPDPVEPSIPAGACALLWGQCGGQSWDGPSCCVAGSYCHEQSQWYHQCQPGDGSEDEAEPRAEAEPEAEESEVEPEAETEEVEPAAEEVEPEAEAEEVEPEDESKEDCAALWGQCGGNTWTGTTCCQAGGVCKVGNEWWHYCAEDNGPSMTQVSQPLRGTLRGRRPRRHQSTMFLEVTGVVSRGDVSQEFLDFPPVDQQADEL